MSLWDRVPETAARRLRPAAERRDLVHAWLFSGPPGSGRRAAAVALAAAVVCPVEPGRGCGTCAVCARVERRTHPDVHHVIPEGSFIRVEAVRDEVVGEAARSPFEATAKFFVIEDAERMNEPAQNSLLKVLEEPPADTTIILLTASEDDILDTLRSRCRMIRFEAISEETIAAQLLTEGVSPDDASAVARAARGSAARARGLALDPDARARRRLWLSLMASLTEPARALEAAAAVVATARDVAKAREKQQKSELADVIDAFGDARGTAALRTALAARYKRELRRIEEDVEADALETIGEVLRDAVALRAGAPGWRAGIDAEEVVADVAARGAPVAALVRAAERCAAARISLTKNANPLLAAEAAFLEVGRALAGAGVPVVR